MFELAQIIKYLMMLFTSGAVISLLQGTKANNKDCDKNNKLCQPEQIHIAFGDKVNDITVTWSTINNTIDTILQYGERKLDKTVKGEKKLFVDGGSLRLSQWIHNVRLKDLKFNTTYVYKVGSEFGWSQQFSFSTPPAGEDGPVRILMLGDMSVNGQSLPDIVEDVSKNHYDFVLHVGDFAYDLYNENGNRGNKFMKQIQPIAANNPYMVCPGNHEYHYNYSHYKNRFSMPGNAESMFYSFNIGPVHFISLNTEAYYDNRDYPSNHIIPEDKWPMVAQYHWLVNDLKEANKPENRQKRPWIIVYGHRPFYCSNSLGADQCANSDTNYYHRTGIPSLGGYALEPLLKDNIVDLEIWAHEHSYERLWPVYNKTVYNGSYEHPYVDPGAPVQFTTGSAGCSEGTDQFFDKPFPYSAFRSSDYGYTRFIAHNKTHLYVEQLSTHDVKASLRFEDAPKKIDEFWLVKNHRKPYNIN